MIRRLIPSPILRATIGMEPLNAGYVRMAGPKGKVAPSKSRTRDIME
jgi:hypothetical protein